MSSIDDLPIRLTDSLASPTLSVRQPADAEAEQYLADWITSRPLLAAGQLLGPTWIKGLQATQVGVLGGPNVRPGVVVMPGVAYPSLVVGGQSFLQRFAHTGGGHLLQLPEASAVCVAVVPQTTVLQAPDSYYKWDGGQVLALALVGVDVGPSNPGFTFWQFPSSVTLDTCVPLALALLDPSTGYLFYNPPLIQDLRLPADGWIYSSHDGTWTVPVEAWDPKSPQNAPGQLPVWVACNSASAAHPFPNAVSVYAVVPAGKTSH